MTEVLSDPDLRGRALMVVGTCSNAGKSLLVTGLCRILARRGWRVAPFKAQNMSLNSAVTVDGHEIGRSTFVQAEAAGVTPHVDMNPVLLKPEADCRSQVILRGRVQGHLESRHWGERKRSFWPEIVASLDALRSRFDLVLLEGAGSPAEINLPDDMANLRVAEYAEASALLVGDIDRGGVFASLLGTMMLLKESQRRLVQGFVINKMRGDVNLLGDGPEMLRQRAFGVPTLGVVPFLPQLGIAEEDSVVLDEEPKHWNRPKAGAGEVDVVVIRLPRLSNFDDFDALAAEPSVRLRFVDDPRGLGHPDAIILPGSKSTAADLQWLWQSGLAASVVDLAGRGCQAVGICGGYQMLGAWVEDLEGVEGRPSARQDGLALLPHGTRFMSHKTTRQVEAVCRGGPGPWSALAGLRVQGYEIHMGQDVVSGESQGAMPLWTVRSDANTEAHGDGGLRADGNVWGTYLHGLFDNDAFRQAWLKILGRQGNGVAFDRQAAYDRWADHLEAHLDLRRLEDILLASKPLASQGGTG